MVRYYAPPEGTPERGGWDRCMDTPSHTRAAVLPNVVRDLNAGPNRDWFRGWLDAWDTIKRGYGPRFKAME